MIERIDLQTVDLQSGAAAVINGAIPVAPFTIAGQDYRTSVPAPEHFGHFSGSGIWKPQ